MVETRRVAGVWYEQACNQTRACFRMKDASPYEGMNTYWVIGALLFIGGVGITMSGFVYDIMFAGIPYQDAPQQLRDSYEVHARIATTIEMIGLGVAGAALVVALFGFVRAHKNKRGQSV